MDGIGDLMKVSYTDFGQFPQANTKISGSSTSTGSFGHVFTTWYFVYIQESCRNTKIIEIGGNISSNELNTSVGGFVNR